VAQAIIRRPHSLAKGLQLVVRLTRITGKLKKLPDSTAKSFPPVLMILRPYENFV
jgi:hypothetical protein